MSKEIHSQDSVSDLEKVWREMENIEPLTPIVEDSIQAYKEAAKSDSFIFGDYDGYQAYRGDD